MDGYFILHEWAGFQRHALESVLLSPASFLLDVGWRGESELSRSIWLSPLHCLSTLITWRNYCKHKVWAWDRRKQEISKLGTEVPDGS